MKTDPLIEILKTEFKRKQSRNGSYSLRSFSRDLSIDPSNLSKIMSYQKKVGPTLRSKLGKKLGFENTEIQGWLNPVLHTNITDQDYNNHNLELFQVISEWHHYAILEYLKLKNKSFKPSVIATHLGLKPSIINNSLKRMLELGLVKKNENEFVSSDESSSSILNVKTSKSHRDQQCQILEGAIDALKNVSVEHRSQSSMTMAIDSNKMDEARELIKNFRRDISRLLSSSDNLDSVYQLSISLYPVTKTNSKEN